MWVSGSLVIEVLESLLERFRATQKTLHSEKRGAEGGGPFFLLFNPLTAGETTGTSLSE